MEVWRGVMWREITWTRNAMTEHKNDTSDALKHATRKHTHTHEDTHTHTHEDTQMIRILHPTRRTYNLTVLLLRKQFPFLRQTLRCERSRREVRGFAHRSCWRCRWGGVLNARRRMPMLCAFEDTYACSSSRAPFTRGSIAHLCKRSRSGDGQTLNFRSYSTRSHTSCST